MSAREMFEELGYKYHYEDKYSITTYYFEDWSISFDLEKKLIGFSNMGCYCELTSKDIQAINKQIEELGWND